MKLVNVTVNQGVGSEPPDEEEQRFGAFFGAHFERCFMGFRENRSFSGGKVGQLSESELSKLKFLVARTNFANDCVELDRNGVDVIGIRIIGGRDKDRWPCLK